LTLCGNAHNVMFMKYDAAARLALILKTLAHPVRVLIVNALTGRDLCVSDLNALVDISQSNVSRHLAQLKQAGIVSDRRRGMKVFYHLQTPCILRAFACAREVIQRNATPRQPLRRGRAA